MMGARGLSTPAGRRARLRGLPRAGAARNKSRLSVASKKKSGEFRFGPDSLPCHGVKRGVLPNPGAGGEAYAGSSIPWEAARGRGNWESGYRVYGIELQGYVEGSVAGSSQRNGICSAS